MQYTEKRKKSNEQPIEEESSAGSPDSDTIKCKSPTQFEKVKTFNETFGLDVADDVRPDLFDTDPELSKRCLDLIREEVSELENGFEKKDLTQVTDALADLLYAVYNAGASFGVDLDRAFDIVHQSNMSKLCKTKQEAKKTVKWYKENMSHRYDSPGYRLAYDQTNWVVFNKSTGKPLKSINWVEPDFTSLGIRKE